MIKSYTKKDDFGELGSIRTDTTVQAEDGSISWSIQRFGVFNINDGQYTFNVVKEVEYVPNVHVPDRSDPV